MRIRTRRFLLVLLLIPALIGMWFAFFYLPAAAYYLLHSKQDVAVLGLEDYRVEIEAKPLSEIHKNLSGLTYRPESNTLFGITNSPQKVVEITLDGEVLRVMPVRGVRDTEGIAHLGGDKFMITDESSNQAWLIEITAAAKEIVASGQSHAQFDLDPLHRNLGIEAVSWNERNQSLWVGQEKWPMRIMEYKAPQLSSLSLDANTAPATTESFQEWRPQWASKWLISDLSSMTHLKENNHVLLLSQESQSVVEFSEAGAALGLLPLWRGMHGLKKGISQAEGLTMDAQGNMYIVAEPNLFYRFAKQTPQMY